MELIRITPENLASEHICCAIANNNDIQVTSKKAWLSERLAEGLVFLKGNVRGKCFIEYLPAESAWAPVSAPDYNYINCLWVAGQFKGQGYSSQLLQECISDSKAQGKKGLAILSSKKKRGFLADHKYLEHQGFQLAATAEPYFELMYLPLVPDACPPSFKPHITDAAHEQMATGLQLYYTNQCPFTAKYVPLLQQMAAEQQIACQIIHLTSREQAQNAPTPFTTFALYYNGKFITHEIQSEKKFAKLLEEITAGR